MMNIKEARRIANVYSTNLANSERYNGFGEDIRNAFRRLRLSANRGNCNDRKLATVLWTYSRINNGTLKPLNS